MKCSVILFITLVSSSLCWGAQDYKILKCLGQEEKRFHLRKEAGPIYDLNQRLISEMVQIPGVEIRPNDYRAICTGKQFSESVKLLEHTIKEGKDLFIIPDTIQGMQKMMAQGMVEEYVDASREILIHFITQIQTLSPTPTCLKEEIPELDAFFTEIKYLQEDVSLKRIFKGKVKKIFAEVRNYPRAFDKCRARLKKKVNSESNPRPKKP